MSCRLEKRYMGGSTSFNGTSSKIQIASLPLLANITTDYAVFGRFWVSGVKPSTVNEMVSCRGGENHFLIRYNTDGKLNYYDWTGGAPSLSTIKALSVGWHSFVAFRNGVNMTLYLDGVVQSTRPDLSGSITWTNTEVMLGANSPGTGAWFKGKQAEVGFAINANMDATKVHNYHVYGELPEGTEHFFPLSDLPSTYLDTVGGATGTGTATTYSPDVPTQLPVALDTEARSSLKNGATNTDKLALENSAGEVWSGDTDLTVFTEAKRLGNASTQGYLFSVPDAAGNNRTYIIVDDTLNILINPASSTTTIGGLVKNNEWFKLTLVKDRANFLAKTYFNGKLVSSVSYTPGTAANIDIVIGNLNNSGATSAFNGLIKTTKMWNRVLTTEEIKALNFSNIVPYKDDPTKLVLNLELNEGAGTTAYDSSGNGNDGTITGATWSASVPSKAREVIGGNLVKNGDLAYQPPFVAATTSSGVWIDGSASGSATNNLFGFGTYVSGTGSVSFDEAENALKLVRTEAALNRASWVGQRKTFSAAIPTVAELPLISKIKPNTAYTLSFKRKHDGTIATNQAQFKYTTYSSVAVRNLNVGVIGNPSTDYTETIVNFTSGATDRYFEVYFMNGYTGFTPTAGTIWVKDISLTETTLPTRTTTTTRTALTCP